MTPSELKYRVEQAGHEPYFFDRKTMRFFGDTMRNYGVCAARVRTPSGEVVACWELYRKKAVKHGLRDSAYFNALTFERVFKDRGEA